MKNWLVSLEILCFLLLGGFRRTMSLINEEGKENSLSDFHLKSVWDNLFMKA